VGGGRGLCYGFFFSFCPKSFYALGLDLLLTPARPMMTAVYYVIYRKIPAKGRRSAAKKNKRLIRIIISKLGRRGSTASVRKHPPYVIVNAAIFSVRSPVRVLVPPRSIGRLHHCDRTVGR